MEKPSVKSAEAMNATLTWMTSQKLCNAGTSCAEGVYSTVMASPRVSSTGPMTNVPR